MATWVTGDPLRAIKETSKNTKSLEFIKGITVLNQHASLKRDVIIYVAHKEYPDISHLSELDIEDIESIISELKTMPGRKNPEDQLEFGVDLCAVTSDWEISHCRDEIHNKDLKSISTSILFAYLMELYQFKKQFANFGILKSIIKDGFETIIKQPISYKKWPQGTYYEVLIDKVFINLNCLKKI